MGPALPVGGWLFTLLSVFVTWIVDPQRRTKDMITDYLLAALLLPAVATTHLLCMLHNSPNSIRHALTSQAQEAVQLAAAEEAPLNTCETFSASAVVLIGISVPCEHRRRALSVLVVTILSFSTEIIRIIGALSDDASIVTFARLSSSSIAGAMVVMTVTAICLITVYLATLRIPHTPTPDLRKKDMVNPPEPSRGSMLGWSVITGSLLAAWMRMAQATGVLMDTVNNPNMRQGLLSFLPKTSMSLENLEKALILAADAVALAFSVFHAAKNVFAVHWGRLAV